MKDKVLIKNVIKRSKSNCIYYVSRAGDIVESSPCPKTWGKNKIFLNQQARNG